MSFGLKRSDLLFGGNFEGKNSGGSECSDERAGGGTPPELAGEMPALQIAADAQAFTELKHSRKFFTTGTEASARRQTSIVCTGGNPGGSRRKTTPGRRISTRVAVTGAMPNPAEINHILIWTSWAY